MKLCEEQGVVVHFAPGFDFLNLGSARMTFNSLHDEPIITVIPPAMKGWKLAVKRAMDIAASLTLITLLLPVFVLISILIKFDSPGSVLFVQERVGLNKRKFKLLKFRTMVTNAEELLNDVEYLNEAQGPVFKIQADPRITRIGKFLRKTSLDELPQLFNVFWGDMSLVGPRPLPLRDYAGFNQDWHRRRFSVRPGITCIWQVSPGNTSNRLRCQILQAVDSSIGKGRGPTNDISPFSILTSCGNSSIEVLRIKRPTRVTRGSLRVTTLRASGSRIS